jgi:hypothetical protein
VITRMRAGALVVLALAVVFAVTHSIAEGVVFAAAVALISAHHTTHKKRKSAIWATWS